MTSAGENTKIKVLRSTIWTTYSKVLSQCMGFITTLVLAHLLAKSDFGLMAMALTFMGLMDNLIDLGFSSAIIQAKEINSKQLSSCFWFLLGISFLASSCTYIAAPHIANIFAEQQLTNIIKYFAPIFLFVPLNIVCRGALSRDLMLDVLAKIELYAGILKMIVSIYFAFLGFGVLSLVIGYLLERFTLTVAGAVAAKWIPRFEFERKCFKQLLAFGSKTTASSLLWYLYTKADVFIIGRLLGAEILGIYSIASQFPQTIVRLVPSTWNRIAYPLFAKYQHSPQLSQIITKSSTHLTLICLPLFTGLAALAPDVIYVLFGSRWQAAIFPMQILSIVAAIETVNSLLPSALNAIGRPGTNAVINMTAAFVFPAVIYYGALQWGLTGVLWVSVALYLYRYLAFLYITCRLINLHISTYLKGHTGSVIASTALFFGVMLLHHLAIDWNSYLRMGVCIILGAILYVAVLLTLSRRQITELVSFVKST